MSLGRCARALFAVFTLVVLSTSGQAAVDGNTYAVIAPTFQRSSGTESYVRFFSGGSAASTFTIRVGGSPSGNTYGTATLEVPQNAEYQRSLTQLLTLTNSGPLSDGDTGYSIYLQNPDESAGYMHVVFNSDNFLFGNASDCRTPLNQVLGSVSSKAALMGVHTTGLGGGSNVFPSVVYFHNYRQTYATYRITVVDSNTGTTICPPNSQTCTLSYGVAPNATLTKNFSEIETDLGWTPTPNVQVHANIILTDPTLGNAPQVGMSQGIYNATLRGSIDMTAACAVNQPTANNPVALATSTTFDGSIASNGASGSLTVTITGNSTSASAPLGTEKQLAAVERPSATLNATGAMRLQGGSSNISLTGTYDTLTNGLTLSGSGYSYSGSVAGRSSVSGTYTGPGSISGSFAMAQGSAASTVRTYCGTYTQTGSSFGGKFNMTMNLTSGVIMGTYKPSGEPGGTFRGNTTGANTLTMTVDSGTSVTGTYSANGTSGTYVEPDGTAGTFSGAVCTSAR